MTRDGVESERYGYDANGNRTSATGLGGRTVTSEQVVVDAQDRLLQYGGLAYTYNPLWRQPRTSVRRVVSTTTGAVAQAFEEDRTARPAGARGRTLRWRFR